MITKVAMPTFMLKQLPEYSSTLPSGVYPGKMWRAQENPKEKLKTSFAVEIPGLEGEWVIGAYFPLDDKQCKLTWLPIQVLPDDCSTNDITEHCYNEECQYLSFNPGGIDDEHHSPNCRGALLRRAGNAEEALAKLRYDIMMIKSLDDFNKLRKEVEKQTI